MSSMEAFHYIKHEHLVLLNKRDMCRFCLLPKTNMQRVSSTELLRSKIPNCYTEITLLQLDITDDDAYPEFMCKKCERNIQLAAKIRRDLLIVDGFWKKFLAKYGSLAEQPKHDEFIATDLKIEDDQKHQPIEIVKIESFAVQYLAETLNQDDDDNDDDGDADDGQREITSYSDDNDVGSVNNNNDGTKPLCGNTQNFRCSQPKCFQEFVDIHCLNEHSWQHHSIRQIACDHCNLLFSQKPALRKHIKVHICKACHSCDKEFNTLSAFKKHMKDCHDDRRRKSPAPSPHTCMQCNKTLKTAGSFRKHMQLTHSDCLNLVCYICGKPYKNAQYLRRHLQVHAVKTKSFKCSYCPKRFELKYSKMLHERVHTGERPFMCDTCGASFTQRGLLARHKLLHSRPATTKMPRRLNAEHGHLKCDLCDSVFSSMASMRSHLKKKHHQQKSAIWDYKLTTTCLKCHKTFLDPLELNKHKKTHRKFGCDICKQRFSYERTLSVHIRQHTTKDRPFKCDDCGASYTRKSHLQQHYRSMHTSVRPHICMFCQKGYAEAYQLKQHIKFVHNKERPYQCQHCDKAFSTAIQLGQHMQYHTGNFRYQCPVCEKCFITGQALTKHGRNSKSCREKNPDLTKTRTCKQLLIQKEMEPKNIPSSSSQQFVISAVASIGEADHQGVPPHMMHIQEVIVSPPSPMQSTPLLIIQPTTTLDDANAERHIDIVQQQPQPLELSVHSAPLQSHLVAGHLVVQQHDFAADPSSRQMYL